MPRKTHPVLVLARSVPAPTIERRIYVIRGQKVMFDRDLAELYEVPTRRLNRAVRRKKDRFPADFMFQLSRQELEEWRYQFGTSNPAARMSLRYRPLVFTEHGVALLSSVLRSRRTVQVNIAIMRAPALSAADVAHSRVHWPPSSCVCYCT